jgi:uncharacterized protein (TIGR02145 family)
MKNKFLKTVIPFGIAFAMCSCNSEIEMVKNGTLQGYEQTTIGKAFESVLGNPKWTYFETNKGVRVVELKGLPGTETPVIGVYSEYCRNTSEVIIQFTLHTADDLFDIAYCEIGENNPVDCNILIYLAYNNSSTYQAYNCEPFGKMTDNRDGQTYNTIKIGDQTWMADNLNYETESSFCNGDDPINCAKYGRLYTWSAAMDSVGTFSSKGKGCGYNTTCSPTYPVRGICPSGWHLPTKEEFEILRSNVGGRDVAGKMLKSITGWEEYDGKSGNGVDAFGFSVFPAGARYDESTFNDAGKSAFFWSATDYNGYSADYLYLSYRNEEAFLHSASKGGAHYSVRCVKD